MVYDGLMFVSWHLQNGQELNGGVSMASTPPLLQVLDGIAPDVVDAGDTAVLHLGSSDTVERFKPNTDLLAIRIRKKGWYEGCRRLWMCQEGPFFNVFHCISMCNKSHFPFRCVVHTC